MADGAADGGSSSGAAATSAAPSGLSAGHMRGIALALLVFAFALAGYTLLLIGRPLFWKVWGEYTASRSASASASESAAAAAAAAGAKKAARHLARRHLLVRSWVEPGPNRAAAAGGY